MSDHPSIQILAGLETSADALPLVKANVQAAEEDRLTDKEVIGQVT